MFHRYTSQATTDRTPRPARSILQRAAVQEQQWLSTDRHDAEPGRRASTTVQETTKGDRSPLTLQYQNMATVPLLCQAQASREIIQRMDVKQTTVTGFDAFPEWVVLALFEAVKTSTNGDQLRRNVRSILTQDNTVKEATQQESDQSEVIKETLQNKGATPMDSAFRPSNFWKIELMAETVPVAARMIVRLKYGAGLPMAMANLIDKLKEEPCVKSFKFATKKGYYETSKETCIIYLAKPAKVTDEDALNTAYKSVQQAISDAGGTLIPGVTVGYHEDPVGVGYTTMPEGGSSSYVIRIENAVIKVKSDLQQSSQTFNLETFKELLATAIGGAKNL
ncbi:MAG: hypothetical protein HC851_21165 [Acaryochloris sp. RU_4_1]|nr:hypothetical protein [Acaryochloris sp. RU_4_1]NJR55362.1 hypothetical protein [Acaryochloris sp. CRU_2_0]